MKRDWNLIREIILQVHASNNDIEDGVDLVLPEVSFEKLRYHINLLDEAGFIEADFRDHKYKTPLYLTWKGQEFADSCQNNSVWKDVLARLSKSGVKVSFTVLAACLQQYTLKHLGIE